MVQHKAPVVKRTSTPRRAPGAAKRRTPTDHVAGFTVVDPRLLAWGDGRYASGREDAVIEHAHKLLELAGLHASVVHEIERCEAIADAAHRVLEVGADEQPISAVTARRALHLTSWIRDSFVDVLAQARSFAQALKPSGAQS